MHALANEPGLLFEGTKDWLHQSYRRPAMAGSFALVESLRRRGWAAVISGAGPTVLVLGQASQLEEAGGLHVPGFLPRRLAISEGPRAWRTVSNGSTTPRVVPHPM